MIKGLDELAKQLSEAEKAIGNLEGNLASVNFDPNDPASIDAAIQEFYATVDAKIGDSKGNQMIEQIVEGLKEQGRQAILDKAAAARLEDGEE